MRTQMHNDGKLYRRATRILAAALTLGVLTFLVAGWTTAQAGDERLELRGTITAIPDGGTGEWVIGGQTFTADASTELDVEDGPLVVDGCAEVKYEDTGSALYAHEIDSEPAGDCDTGGGGGDGGGQPADLLELRGAITVIPDGGTGEWVIGGQTFTADASTELDVEDGPLVVDGCAEVKYEDTGSALYAHEIDSEPAGDCDTGDGGGDGGGQPADLLELRGAITVIPDGGTGEWVIGGQTFTADASTELDVEDGPLVVDGCAEVKYEDTGSALYAHEIDSEPAGDCDTGDGGGDGGGQPADLLQLRGAITVIPDGGTGEWVIGGQTFTADASTELDVEDGPLVVDGCAEVKYEDTGSALYAHEIDSEPAGDCDTGGGGGDDDGDDDVKRHGLVDSAPAGGREGEWTIGGIVYLANSSTEFETEHGPLAVGACVEVESDGATPATAKKIETEHQYRCTGTGAEPPKAETYGVVSAFPADLIGTWMIGGMQFEADANTEFEQEHGPFEIGGTVKVHFYTDENDVHHALEIKSKFGSGDDEDDVDDQRGEEGHAFGIIDGLPAGNTLLGQWSIGGIAYEVDASTDLEAEHSPFAVGARVRVEYHTKEGGLRVADEIETTGDDGEVRDPGHTKLLGFVEHMPPSGFLGVWKIAGVEFVVNESSVLEEENGLFGVGSYVEVEYSISAPGRVVHEMKTHVPPSAGDDTRLGVITGMESAMQASEIEQTSSSQWTIGGVSYTVTTATRLVDGASDLAIGSTALVNSYVAGDGRAIATSIRGVAVDNQIYLPVANR